MGAAGEFVYIREILHFTERGFSKIHLKIIFLVRRSEFLRVVLSRFEGFFIEKWELKLYFMKWVFEFLQNRL